MTEDQNLTADAKHAALVDLLRSMDGVAVAFSGGVDSSLLLLAAREALGDRVLAITARSPLYCTREQQAARETAKSIGASHRFIENDALDTTEVAHNHPDRCYHCKLHGFRAMLDITKRERLQALVEGSNVDDQSDYRPGMRAVAELGVRSPLREVGLTKSEIRALVKARGLRNWDQPAMACLASRIPFGEHITPERLHRIDAAEEEIRSLGVRQVRVRDHGSLARIEIPSADFARIIGSEVREKLVSALRRLGYQYVSLDIEGYRMGAMNICDGEAMEADNE